MIDTLYDNRVRVSILLNLLLFPSVMNALIFKVVISAEVPLDNLFSAEKVTGDITDEQRQLMDDLKITPVSHKCYIYVASTSTL